MWIWNINNFIRASFPDRGSVINFLTGTRNPREFLQPHEKTPADHAGVLDYLFHRSETDVFSVEQCIGLVLDAVHAVVCGIHCCIDCLSVAGG